MRYNTTQGNLIIKEYGRNIQRLIEHAVTIEDAQYRQAFTEKIVQLILQMHPQTQNIDDSRKKIWAHIFHIADYKLEVTPPDPSIRNIPPEENPPSRIPYPTGEKKYRHYGKNVRHMIEKAMNMEDGEKRRAFAEVIGAYMKMAYRTWNQESTSDEIIKHDLSNFSNGVLVLSDNANLDNLIQPNRKRKRPNKSNKKSSHKNHKKRK